MLYAEYEPTSDPEVAEMIRRNVSKIVVPTLLMALAIASQGFSDYALEIGFRLMVMITLAEAWNLLAGYGGLVSLGTASFVGIGAYALTGLVNNAHLPLYLAIPGAGLAAAMLALLVSRAVFRLRGLYFTVGTLALAEALRMFMVNYDGFGGASGLFLSQDPPGLYALFCIAIGLMAVTTLVITIATASRFSILLRAVRDDEDAAAQIGVKAFRIKLVAFVLASFLMGMAGALQGLKVGTVEPYGMFGIQWTVSVLSIVIIGGQGLRLGPVAGAFFVIALGEVLADYPALHLAITGVILIVVIRFAPKGLVGLARDIAARNKGEAK
ncbi:branched-chain amino acid ABC transporter permease [Rhodoferax sp. GW822-FHT02A01]|uniref:branched-chain amino acid ABC transporter permease n=1 Tax=Rhodoferax sp. GW822-FHT02A01 TaxID=3141537 RepID=UPI00315D59EA